MLYDPAGGLVSSSSTNTELALQTNDLALSGIYTYVIRDAGGDEAGTYSLRVI